MSVPALLLGSIFVGISVFMVLKSKKKMAILKKYELNNRSEDGTVQFENIDLSRAHTADKGLYTVIGIFGFFVGVFGAILVMTGFGLGS
ncbi:MAG: hypothetical protein DSY80_03945 [Desulfocapsa sp.]|nr:MAG: hypothetical protein DSY80_03945 [Desulfocapsa sp.]